MKCPQCQNDNPAAAKFCLNCGAVLSARCPDCQGKLPADARFCMHCGQSLRARTPDDEMQHTRLAAAAPTPLAEKARAATHLSGERRVVTVLLIDIVGSTALTQQMELEDWTAVLSGVFDRIAPAIYRYEGTIARLLGDALVAFFGAPVAHEDDPLRAVSAALEAIAATRVYAEQVRQEYGVDLRVRACLNTGPVVIGPVGSDLRYEYMAMGGTVNLAARIKFAAPPMTVLISQHTYRFVEPFFDCVERRPVEVSGRAEPVRVYQVRAHRAEPGRVRGLAGLQSPMVGRHTELERLLGLCEAVRAGLGRAVSIVGEPGVGKTRLIAEWKAAVAQVGHQPAPRWGEGRGLSYGQGLAYHLLIDLMHSLLSVPAAAEEPQVRAALQALTEDVLGDQALDVYPYLGHLLSLKMEDAALERVRWLDPQALQAQYLGALRRLLQAWSKRRPLILIVEDLHWADPSSTDLLIQLLPLISTVPVLLCLVGRPERDVPGWKLVTTAREVLGGSLTELALDALSEDDSRRLVANLLEIEALPEATRRLILRKAEGNPLFVEEVIRMLIDRGAIAWQEGRWVAGEEIGDVEIPDNLQGLLLARIDRLPDEVKHTLRVAAVIGRQFPVKVLAEVLGEEVAG